MAAQLGARPMEGNDRSMRMGIKLGVAVALVLGCGSVGPGVAPASAAAAASSHAAFTGVWASLSRTPSEGLLAGAPMTLRNTDWAPLSLGKPEDRKAQSYEELKAVWTDLLENNKDIFKYFASQRIPPNYTPAGAQAVADAKAAAAANPAARGPYDSCLPRNTIGVANTFELYQSADRISQIYENGTFRTIYMDGKDHSAATPTYMGVSVGRWDGATLVVTTDNFLGDNAGGWPMSPKAKVTETFSLSADGGLMTVKTLYEDPEMLMEPMARMTYLDRKGSDYEMLPQSCIETVKGAAEYAATFGAEPPK